MHRPPSFLYYCPQALTHFIKNTASLKQLSIFKVQVKNPLSVSSPTIHTYLTFI